MQAEKEAKASELALCQVTIETSIKNHKEALSSIQAELLAEKPARIIDLALCCGPYIALANSPRDIGALVEVGYNIRHRHWGSTRAKAAHTTPDKQATRLGNSAAHDPNAAADYAFLPAGGHDSADDEALFKKQYGD